MSLTHGAERAPKSKFVGGEEYDERVSRCTRCSGQTAFFVHLKMGEKPKPREEKKMICEGNCHGRETLHRITSFRTFVA